MQPETNKESGEVVVQLTGVCKSYRQRQRSERLQDLIRSLLRPVTREIKALQSIDLTVTRGEIVAYAGPNGAGKSTTVKLLAGMLAADSGTVRCLGLDPFRDRVRYVGRIAVVFGQRTELWWDHPIAASFEWKRVVWNIPRDRFARMSERVKEMLGLGEFFQSLARELSLGQRMRAELGLALIHDPEILFLDEATIGLDVLAKRHILQLVQELNRERQVTVIVTSHDMSELEQLAGRIVLIHQGQIAFDGDFSQLRAQFGDRRRLLIESSSSDAPVLNGATYLRSEGPRHEYVFDAGATPIALLLQQASVQVEIRDVETHREAIDDVIAAIYTGWQQDSG